MKEILQSIYLKAKDLLISYYKYFIFLFIIIVFVLMGFDSYNNIKIICSNRKPSIPIENPKPYDANYSSDMNFLECIGEQHSCLYKNLNNNIDHRTILEKCKDEKYCNQNSRSVHVRIPK